MKFSITTHNILSYIAHHYLRITVSGNVRTVKIRTYVAVSTVADSNGTYVAT